MSSYTDSDLSSAVEDVRQGTPLRSASKQYGIPKSTIYGRLNGASPRTEQYQDLQKLSPELEDRLVKWILNQESLGFAPTHHQVRVLAASLIQDPGDRTPLGKKWIGYFLKRHPELQTKLGRRTEWARINAATPANINAFFQLYHTMSWIPPARRYNADEGGLMEGEGTNGLVIGSSECKGRRLVPIKASTSRTWTSIIECVSATGVLLEPTIIFKGATIQDQWFRDSFARSHPTWHTTVSENGWTSNDIAVEWLERVFLPQTDTGDPSDTRLLVLDGHGSHTTDEFITTCFLNNVHLLFLPAHTSHVLQPLDLGCFSSLKAKYRTLVSEFIRRTDGCQLGKRNFLEFYTEARKVGLRKDNILSGWRSTGLWPENRRKPLSSPWVLVPQPAYPAKSSPSIFDDHPTTPKKGRDVKQLLAHKGTSPGSRLIIRKIGKALDIYQAEQIIRDQEVAALKARIEELAPRKRRKVQVNPNERFVTLAEVLSQRGSTTLTNQDIKDEIVVAAEEEEVEIEEEEEDLPSPRRFTRLRSHRYMDLSSDEESSF